METEGLAVYETAIGHCGIAWNSEGAVIGSQLPEGSPERTLARLRRAFPDATEQQPPAKVRAAIEAVMASLRGEPADLSAIDVDLGRVPPFHRRVYEVARSIPPGSTLTYGEVATRLGDPGSARAVGQALGSNPFAPIVPCHRILAAGGKPGGFSARGGLATKRRMLASEGCYLEEPTLFDV